MHSISWDALTRHQWQQSFASADNAAYQQHWDYGQAVKAFGGKVHRASIERDGRIIAVVQFQCRQIFRTLTVALAMRGPVWLENLDTDCKSAIYADLRASLPVRSPRLALWMPESADDAAALKLARRTRVVSSYHTVMLDLTQSRDMLEANLEGKWRNRLRAAQKEALTLTNCSANLAHYSWLLEKESHQRQRIGYAALTPQLVPVYQQLVDKPNPILCLRAEHEGQAVAGLLCLIHGHAATYHIGWSNETGKKLSAHNLLLWEAIQKLSQKNITRFDLGGINTQDGAGIARFKIGTGGEVLSLPGTYL